MDEGVAHVVDEVARVTAEGKKLARVVTVCVDPSRLNDAHGECGGCEGDPVVVDPSKLFDSSRLEQETEREAESKNHGVEA